MLCLHGGDRAVSGGGDDLTQALDADIAGGEHAGDIRAHIGIGDDIAVVHLHNAIKKLGVGLVADEAEQTEHAVLLVGMDDGLLAGLDIAEGHRVQQALAVHALNDAVPDKGDFGVGKRLLLDGLGGTKLVAAVDDRDLAGKLGQIHGLLDRTVAAADDINLVVLEEGRVARGAEGDAAAGELALVFAADGAGEGAGGDDDGLCLVLALVADDLLDLTAEVNALDDIAAALGTELRRLLAHARDQTAAALALDALAGIVLDLVGLGDLAAVLSLFDDQGAQTGAAGVQSGRKTGRAGAENNNIINLAHVS